MSSLALRTELNFETIECYKCAVVFAVPHQLYEQRRRDHESFWCPNGHSQCFTGKSKEEQLKADLEAVRAKATDEIARANKAKEWAEQAKKLAEADAEKANRRLKASRAYSKRLRGKIKAGCCTLCDHKFADLAAHMAEQHPSYK